MSRALIWAISVWLALHGVAGAAEGDDLLALASKKPAFDNASVISATRERVRALLKALQLPDDRRAAFEAMPLRIVMFESRSAEINRAKNAVILVDGDIRVPFAEANVIIATGKVEIPHGSHNVVIAGGRIDVGHDGAYGIGSVLASKTTVDIGHAKGTIVYAPSGLRISHATDVVALNTPVRDISFGQVNDIEVARVFRRWTWPWPELKRSPHFAWLLGATYLGLAVASFFLGALLAGRPKRGTPERGAGPAVAGDPIHGLGRQDRPAGAAAGQSTGLGGAVPPTQWRAGRRENQS